MNSEKASVIVKNCLNEMYKASTPPITWAQLNKKYANTKVKFYQLHKITGKDYDRIKAKYLKQLPKIYHHSLEWCLLDYSPMEAVE